MGVFFDAHYSSRGFKLEREGTSPLESSAGYLDIPLGFAMSFGRSFFSAESRTTIRLGAYYAVPLGNFKGDFGATSQGYFGAMFDSKTLFSVTDGFALGYTFWVKYPFGSAIAQADNKFYDVGIGLAATFF